MDESMKWYSSDWKYLCVARGNGKSQLFSKLVALRVELKRIKAENEQISMYPNKRVVYLALHGHGRTRKKNRNRALKWVRSNILEVKG